MFLKLLNLEFYQNEKDKFPNLFTKNDDPPSPFFHSRVLGLLYSIILGKNNTCGYWFKAPTIFPKCPTLLQKVYDGIVNFVGITSDLMLYYIEPHINNSNSLKPWSWPSFTGKKCSISKYTSKNWFKDWKTYTKFLLVFKGLILYLKLWFGLYYSKP